MSRIPPDDQDIHALRREVQDLRESVQHLTILNEIAAALSTAKDLNTVLDQLLAMAVANMGAEQGAIWLFRDDPVDTMKTLVRKIDGYGAAPKRLGPRLAGWVSVHAETLVVDDLAQDARFPGISEPIEGVRSVLAVPLRSRDNLIGVLALFNKKDGKFTTSDARLATILGAQSAQTIENVRHLEQERVQESLARDLQLASDVQQQLLPQRHPSWPGFQVAGKNVPAREVGGDGFEFIDLDGGRVAFAIADVSGKGVAAALTMANLHATLRCLAPVSATVSGCVARTNHMLCESVTAGRYATLFYGVLDLAARRLDFCNAGHPFPLLLRQNGVIERLENGGIPVGLMQEWTYCESSVELHPGDVLLLFSDGITEAENERQDHYGEQPMTSVLKSCAQLPADEIIQQLLRSVDRFAAGTPQSDDQTLIVVRAL